MSKPVKRYRVSGYGNGMIEADDGLWYHEDDYARLEQECARLQLRLSNLEIVQAASLGVSGLIKSAASEIGFDPAGEDSALDYLIGLARRSNTALNQSACLRDLLTRCKEHLDPHRDAAPWSDVCAALGPKP